MRDIAPQIKTKLWYQIPQLQDTATYYVQAVVRDLVAGTILGTYNLNPLGNQAFSKEWTTPADNSGGNGRELVITFTVYDDAGYTTPSMNYGAKAEYYRIIQPWNLMVSGGGMGFVSGFSSEEVRDPLMKGYEDHRKQIGEENKKHREEVRKAIDDLREEVEMAIEKITGVSMDMGKNSSEKFSSLSDTSKKMEDLHSHAVLSLQNVVESHEREKKELRQEFDSRFIEHSGKMGELFSEKLNEAREDMKKDFNTQMVAFFRLLEHALSNIEKKIQDNDPKEHARIMLRKMLNGDLGETKKGGGLSEILGAK